MLAPNELMVRGAEQIGQTSNQVFFVTVETTVSECDFPQPFDQLGTCLRIHPGSQAIGEIVHRA